MQYVCATFNDNKSNELKHSPISIQRQDRRLQALRLLVLVLYVPNGKVICII